MYTHTYICIYIYIYIYRYIYMNMESTQDYIRLLSNAHTPNTLINADWLHLHLHPLIKYFHKVCLSYPHAQILSSAPRSWYIYIRHVNPYTLQIVCTGRVFHPHARHSFHGARARHHRVLPACQVRYMKWCMKIQLMQIFVYKMMHACMHDTYIHVTSLIF